MKQVPQANGLANNRHVITQGEQLISANPDVVISTLLGSCVACCLWDPQARVGGMNHMLFADRAIGGSLDNLAGINAMELLINGVLRQGGARDQLLAKAFGGANMLQSNTGVGAQNASFALNFLEREGIPCRAKSLGGTNARHLLFWPTTGAAKQKLAQKAVLGPVLATKSVQGNDVDLF